MNFTDDCINVNTLIIEVTETLEKRNSATICNRTNMYCVRLRLKEHTHKGTHVFIFLYLFNSFMNLGEFFRLDICNRLAHFFVIG